MGPTRWPPSIRPSRLTTGSSNDGWPSWSPDGRLIAYQSFRQNRCLICTLDPETGRSGQLKIALQGFLWEPAWSSDGRWLAVSNQPARRKSDIHVVRPDGSGLRRLMDNNAIDGAPRWSPDGAMIAFVSERDGNPEIYVMRVAGDGSGETRRLTFDPAADFGPAWRPSPGTP